VGNQQIVAENGHLEVLNFDFTVSEIAPRLLSMKVAAMKIGVLSDTHIGRTAQGMALSERLLTGPFAGVDVILHAGDQVLPELESCFSPLPWYAVRGNMDTAAVSEPLKRVVELGGTRIGMIHGWGAPAGIEQRVLAEFARDAIDVLVFGHSHQPLCRREGDVLLLNPGSPTDRRHAPRHTVGLLTLSAGIHGEIITLD
jgi:putative phosphoesterase